VHDDELELDVDEIPEAVLQDLYRFVKAHRKAVGADITADDEDYEDPSTRRSSGAGTSNKPAATQRKKNKPMSAREQESKIAQVRRQLEKFGGGGDGKFPNGIGWHKLTGDAGDGDDIETSEDEESSSSEEE
jgi:bromodomain-containing factor 1